MSESNYIGMTYTHKELRKDDISAEAYYSILDLINSDNVDSCIECKFFKSISCDFCYKKNRFRKGCHSKKVSKEVGG